MKYKITYYESGCIKDLGNFGNLKTLRSQKFGNLRSLFVKEKQTDHVVMAVSALLWLKWACQNIGNGENLDNGPILMQKKLGTFQELGKLNKSPVYTLIIYTASSIDTWNVIISILRVK